MTHETIERLNELHLKSHHCATHTIGYVEFGELAHAEWPAIAAELTRLTKELKISDASHAQTSAQAEQFCQIIEKVSIETTRLRELCKQLQTDNLRLRKVLSYVPGAVAIKAKEDAGFGDAITPKVSN